MTQLLKDSGPQLVMETGDYDGMVSPRTAESIEYLESLGYDALEYGANGLRAHTRRARYEYGNLFFSKGVPGTRSTH